MILHDFRYNPYLTYLLTNMKRYSGVTKLDDTRIYDSDSYPSALRWDPPTPVSKKPQLQFLAGIADCGISVLQDKCPLFAIIISYLT